METRVAIVTTGGADGANVTVKEIDAVANSASGAGITARNNSGATVATNDLGILTRDHDGVLSFFFKSSGGGPPVDDFKTYITIEDTGFSYIIHMLSDTGEGSGLLALFNDPNGFLYHSMTNASGGYTVTCYMDDIYNMTDPTRYWAITTPDGMGGNVQNSNASNDGTNSWSITGFVRASSAPADTVPGGW